MLAPHPVSDHSIPRKAISYFSSSLTRQGKYGRRPKVEMPEKTESALNLSIEIFSWHEILTCVPPSPGKVLYHRDLCGPEIGAWSPWSPWASTEAQKAQKERALSNMLNVGYYR
jgi:hypothetical protein